MRTMRSTLCRVSRPLARMTAVDREEPNRLVGLHAESCLRCQAEMAIEQRIGRALAGMRPDLMIAPAGLMAAVMGSLDTALPPPEREVPKVAVAAAMVGVASALAWTLSRRARGRA